MKKIFTLIMLAAIAGTGYSQTLFTYGKKAVSKEEFLNAFNRNNNNGNDRKASVNAYLELYKKYKLKVQAAEDKQIDTLPQIKSDIESFRYQIMDRYLTDADRIKQIEKTAWERSQKDLHVYHTIVRSETGAEAEAEQKANALYADLSKAEKNSIANLTDLGYLTVFSLPYNYEDIIYSLQEGEVSKPYYSKGKWHIFKVTESRPGVGTWQVSQILFALPPAPDAATQQNTLQKAKAVHQELKKGASFEEMVSKYSNDIATTSLGGKLGEFGTGKYKADFEGPVFALKTNGAITEPFLTAAGYHIVRRDSVILPYKEFTDPYGKYWLEQKLQRDDRLQHEKNRYKKEIVSTVFFKKTSPKTIEAIVGEAKANFKNNTTGNVASYEIGKFKNGKALSFQDFYNHYGQYVDANGSEKISDEIWNDYVTTASVAHYKEYLQDYNTEFYYQLKEFRDGNLLFEIMEQKVWGVAGKDEKALQNFYDKKPEDYVWDKSALVEIFNCADKATAETAMQKSKQGISFNEIAKASEGNVHADSGRYELTQIMSEDYKQEPKENGYSEIVNNRDQTYAFVHYLKLYPAGERRQFKDARGEVVSKYQDKIEEEWIKEVEAKYPIKVYEAVLKSIMQ